MPRISRVVLPGHAHHVTQRGVRSQAIFLEADDQSLYLSLLSEQTRRFQVEVLCYCLMTNHVHLLAVPSDALGLARAIGEAHRRYTLQVNRRLKVRGYLFQGRFASCPLDGDHLVAAARYVLLNPVRAGLTPDAISWPYSSAAFHTGEKATDILIKTNDLLGFLPDTEAWRQLMESDEDERADRLRRLTRTGRPCGDESFVEQAELVCQRPLQPRLAGRPRSISKTK